MITSFSIHHSAIPYMTFFETHRHIEHIDFMIKIHLKLCVLCVYVFQKKIIQYVLKAK